MQTGVLSPIPFMKYCTAAWAVMHCESPILSYYYMYEDDNYIFVVSWIEGDKNILFEKDSIKFVKNK